MELVPLHDRVVIEPSEAEAKTPGGLHLPETSKEKPTKGTVVAVGAGRLCDTWTSERLEMTVKVGDTVLYERYAGTEVEVDGKKYVIIPETGILVILKEGEN